MGEWNPGYGYIPGDLITFLGITYYCILYIPGANYPPSSPNVWLIIADKGATGSTGDIGDTGSTGPSGSVGPALFTFTTLVPTSIRFPTPTSVLLYSNYYGFKRANIVESYPSAFLTFRVTQRQEKVIGFIPSSEFSNADYHAKYGFHYDTTTSNYYIYEQTNVGAPINYSSNDIFTITIANNTASYFHNGSNVYQSTGVPVDTYVGNCSLFTVGDIIDQISYGYIANPQNGATGATGPAGEAGPGAAGPVHGEGRAVRRALAAEGRGRAVQAHAARRCRRRRRRQGAEDTAPVQAGE
jgi:hypothetical protein